MKKINRAIVTLAFFAFLVSAQARAGSTKMAFQPRLVLRTVAGDMVFVLYPGIAPKTVEQILKLAKLGVYNSTHFFRLEPGFVIQLANAQERLVAMRADQSVAIKKIPAEFSILKHEAGMLSMARFDGDVNSAETSFSILLNTAPHLDGKYTIFGKIERGAEVLVELVKTPRNGGNKPRTRLSVLSAEAIESQAALDAVRLVPAMPVEVEKTQEEASGMGLTTKILLCGVLFMLCLSTVVALFARYLTSSQQTSFHLLQVLVAAVLCLATLIPSAARAPWIGASLLFGLVAVFKLISRFENAS